MGKSLYTLLIIGIFISGCKDFFEPSLDSRNVILTAPANGSESNKYQTVFWWESVSDALKYRLQIVKPNFSSPVSLIVDTLILTQNKYQLTLEPGSYEWRVRAENGSSASKYTTVAFIIHESALTDQTVTLASPANNYISNVQTVGLSWDALFGAERYRLQIDTLNFQDESKLVYNQEQSSNKFTYTFLKDQSYQWRVRAENSTEISRWSVIRIMAFDQTPPGIPGALSPASESTVTQPVNISWTAVNGAKKYKLYLYKSDRVTPYNTIFPLTLTATIYQFNQGVSGDKIYWKVTAIDGAGNESGQSPEMNFSIP